MDNLKSMMEEVAKSTRIIRDLENHIMELLSGKNITCGDALSALAGVKMSLEKKRNKNVI